MQNDKLEIAHEEILKKIPSMQKNKQKKHFVFEKKFRF